MATPSKPIILKITDAGKRGALNTTGDAVNLSVNLTHVAIGSGRYTPTGKETKIKTLIAKIATASGEVDASNTLQFSATIYADKITPVYELGLLSEDGTLFAIAAAINEPLFTLYPNVTFVVAFGLALNEASADKVTVTINPNASLMPTIMQNHLAAPNPHPQYLGLEHLDVTKDPHPQYLDFRRFQLLLEVLIPMGYLHHTHSTANPKPDFDELLGIETAWRRLTGKIIVATDPDDPFIKDVGLTIGQKGMTSDAGVNRPHTYPLYTTNVFERYNPDDVIETVWQVSANKTVIDEGAAIRFTLTASNVPDGQILKWTVKEGALNSASNDVTAPDATKSGSVILKNGSAIIDYTTTPDDNIAEAQKHVRLTVAAPANLSMNVPIMDAGRTEKFIHITSSTLNGIVLDEYFKQHSGAYPVSTDKVRFIINPYVDVIGFDSASPAIDAGKNWPAGSEIIVENRGRILGHGGSGGNTARFSQHRESGLNNTTNPFISPKNNSQFMYDLTKPAGAGGDGGTAIRGNIKVENYGLIAGGGGGVYYAKSDTGYGIEVTTGMGKIPMFIGGGGGSGGGAPLGKRYPNLHSLDEFYEHFNPTGATIPEPTDGNYITHVRTNNGKLSTYSIAGANAGSRGEYPLPTVTTSIADESMFSAPRWVDEAKGFYYWQDDSEGVLKQSLNATIDTAGSYGYQPADNYRMSGIPPDINKIPVNSIQQNHGGAGGAIGENGGDGVMNNFYDFYGQVPENDVVKKLLPAKGGRAGLVKEGNVIITNHSGGVTKGR